MKASCLALQRPCSKWMEQFFPSLTVPKPVHRRMKNWSLLLFAQLTQTPEKLAVAVSG